jgi:hypothetical protein
MTSYSRDSLGDEIAAHLACCDCWYRRGEEKPDVGTIARARSLHRDRDTDAPAGLDECAHIFLPRALVEVSRKEPAGFVVEEWVDAHDVAAREMPDDRGVVGQDERLVRALAALHLGQLTDASDELVPAGRRITGFPGLLAHEPRREDVLASTE